MTLDDLDALIEHMYMEAPPGDTYVPSSVVHAWIAKLREWRENAVEGWAHDYILDPPLLVDGTLSPRSTYFYEHDDLMLPDTKHTEGLVPALLITAPRSKP